MQNQKLFLTPQERSRIVNLLDAARIDDWARFKALSDGDFPNDESMREQFDGSRLIIDYDRIDPEQQFAVGVDPDGFRLITGQLPPRDDQRQQVIMTICSKNLNDGPFISVWTFHEELDISSL
ncbi:MULTISPECIES: hypothetical protein [unclassified Mesorhizobium]|uniref:hypothetical protein n=1 Tax=unclassified Mesorhizobium TaxID=325217 RepID=UPI000FCC194C|nr:MULTISPECIES: hypothetical protein [unclassified Mesorhizobium]RUZ66833.1 hypothetical protein EN947_32595 [Mesorhizobium sp. M7A.F.Ca.US.003.02.2.1]RUY86802.1 hypothetical protein EN974_33365 [Mesorhizobium sp. M7A.F.Ca.CA.001.12.2.1]RUZ28235.1 hypothetical protein EN949_07145 [Mesorhizobium sp. M7A.F.Ca.US.007.01.2.1]RUZ47793.1 hypothetical protein EN948_10760 [Mesorhizobium sp. M7A.F.Ca.US.003.02.1.1]RUZ66450.1 hypothetical protein EN950_11525 [Mesorhizobium sp. M7A.F.Ca.US.007.01.1.1]